MATHADTSGAYAAAARGGYLVFLLLLLGWIDALLHLGRPRARRGVSFKYFLEKGVVAVFYGCSGAGDGVRGRRSVRRAPPRRQESDAGPAVPRAPR